LIDGVELTVSAEAVVVTADRLLTVISSAAAGGGMARARAIVNLRVDKNMPWQDADLTVESFVRRHAIARPVVGLLTAAATEKAQTVEESAAGVSALVVATVGLSNAIAAGESVRAAASPSTINIIVILDADPEPAALVNVVMTVTEVKTAVLAAAGVRCAGGAPASGTSTDSVAVAATGRGERCRFGGPVSDLGWVAARAARGALAAGVRRWMETHP
jgi:iron complex transport system ATP-binding protein